MGLKPAKSPRVSKPPAIFPGLEFYAMGNAWCEHGGLLSDQNPQNRDMNHEIHTELVNREPYISYIALL